MNRLFPDAQKMAYLGHLQCLGAMHIAATLDKILESEPNFVRGPTSIKNDIQIIINAGSPADFAFTIFILVDSVSNYIKRCREPHFDQNINILVFKNFAYKLRGAKRIAFIANLCASLHYDIEPLPVGSYRLHQLQTMADYALDNFVMGSKAGMSEIRIYLTFISLIMADVFEHVGKNYMNCLEYIKKANLENNFDDFRWFGLCQFLFRYSDVFENPELEMTDRLLNYAVIMLPDWQVRCRKAICAIRHSRIPSKFVTIWKKRLGNALEVS